MRLQALWRAPLGTPTSDKEVSGNRKTETRRTGPGWGRCFPVAGQGLKHVPESSCCGNRLAAESIVTILLRGR